MISLEQIKLLETRIEKALLYIAELTNEKKSLKTQCGNLTEENAIFASENQSLTETNRSLRGENDALRTNLVKYQSEQSQIEQTVLHVIDRLEAVETTILETVVKRAESAPVQPAEHRIEMRHDAPVQIPEPVETPLRSVQPVSGFGFPTGVPDGGESESEENLFGISGGESPAEDGKELDIF